MRFLSGPRGALKEFEVGAFDRAEVVIEIPKGGLQVAVSKQGLHVAYVLGEFEHAHGDSAAEVVRHELARDADRDEELAIRAVKLAGDEDGRLRWLADLVVKPVAELKLTHEGLRRVEVARLDERGDFRGDREGEAFAPFGDKAELARGGVVVLRAELAGGAAAYAEVRAEQDPEP